MQKLSFRENNIAYLDEPAHSKMHFLHKFISAVLSQWCEMESLRGSDLSGSGENIHPSTLKAQVRKECTAEYGKEVSDKMEKLAEKYVRAHHADLIGLINKIYLDLASANPDLADPEK